MPRPRGPRGAPLLRRFLLRGDVPGFFVGLERDYPLVTHLRILGEHAYVINSPDAIVDVFLTHGRMTMKGRGLQGTRAVLGNGLLTSEGETHLRNRRLVQPAFHRDRIAGYARDMVALAEEHGRAWQPGTRVDMQSDMAALTLAIVGRTLFGADLTGDARDVGAALNTMLEGMGNRLLLGPAALRLPTPGQRQSLAAAAALDALVQRLIDDHRSTGDTGDMLSMLIAAQEDGIGFDDDQVRDEAMTLVLAGHETTAMTLTWTWLLLARNPAEAAWLHEELDDVLSDGPPAMEDVAHLPRTRAVVAESLRLYPPAWMLGRRLLEDRQIGGDGESWTLPAGSIAIISPFALQRSPRWWDSSLAFRPQRWIDAHGQFSEDAPGQPRGAWFPFGWGNRRCIGESFAWTEAVLVLATLARDWAPTVLPGHEVTPRPAVTLRTSDGLPMTLVRRR